MLNSEPVAIIMQVIFTFTTVLLQLLAYRTDYEEITEKFIIFNNNKAVLYVFLGLESTGAR
jgi:hypothetical protein